MPWGTNGKTRNLAEQVAYLRKLSPPPPDEITYRYLEKVYRVRRRFGANAIKGAAKKLGVSKVVGKPTSIRLLIELTSGVHVTSGLKWKWANALDYARRHKILPAELRTFIQKNGGINGCVEKNRALLRASNGGPPCGIQ